MSDDRQLLSLSTSARRQLAARLCPATRFDHVTGCHSRPRPSLLQWARALLSAPTASRGRERTRTMLQSL